MSNEIKFAPEIKSIPPRNLFPIKNKFHLEATKYDISVVIYFITKNWCTVVLRRHDADTGWDENLELHIEDEVISIPPSPTYSREITLPVITNLEMDEIHFEQLIPKVIIQTAETNTCNIQQYNAMKLFIDMNPEYEYRFFDACERREFIKKYFVPAILEAYDTLVPGAFQADLFRYCYLFKNGGCYFDFKMIPRKPLRDIINSNDSLLVCSDYERSNSPSKRASESFLNALIFATPNILLFSDLVEMCVRKILHDQNIIIHDIYMRGDQGILDLTGPKLMYRVFSGIPDNCIRFKHYITNNDESSYKNFVIKQDNEVVFHKTHTTVVSPTHYSFYWGRKEVFYKNKRVCGNYIIYVFPNMYPDVFEFTISNNVLTIYRNDGGWWLDLTVKVINNTTNASAIIFVGKNGTFTKNVLLPLSICSEVPISTYRNEYDEMMKTHNDKFSELDEIVKKTKSHLEGNIFYLDSAPGQEFVLEESFTDKRYNLFQLGKNKHNIIEIGFNAGHSTLLLLLASPTSKIALFDYGSHPYSKLCFDYLNKTFPDRLSLHVGDSMDTLPKHKSPEIKCDFIHIDGGHTKNVVVSDILNCVRFSDSNTLVCIDDYLHPEINDVCNLFMTSWFIERQSLPINTECHLLVKYKMLV